MNDLPPPPETPREEPHLESKQLSAPLRYLLSLHELATAFWCGFRVCVFN